MEEILVFSKQFATTLFLIFFIMVLVRTYSRGRKSEIEQIRYSIFDEEEIRGMH